jgi:hypothetical protein
MIVASSAEDGTPAATKVPERPKSGLTVSMGRRLSPHSARLSVPAIPSHTLRTDTDIVPPNAAPYGALVGGINSSFHGSYIAVACA